MVTTQRELGPRTCVFCHKGSTSREHIWPSWFTRINAPSGLRATRRAVSIERGQWVANKVDLPVKRFCRNCNSTWMSAIVDEASPLLKQMIGRDGSVSLTSKDQLVLARAAYLTALTADFALRADGTKPIPQRDYDSFYEHKEPPQHGRIWIAAYKGTHHWASISRLGLISEDTAPGLVSEEGPPHEFHLTTYLMSCAVFQVVGQTFRGNAVPRRPPADTPFISGIWPVSESNVAWPPNGLALDDSNIETFLKGRGFF